MRQLGRLECNAQAGCQAFEIFRAGSLGFRQDRTDGSGAAGASSHRFRKLGEAREHLREIGGDSRADLGGLRPMGIDGGSKRCATLMARSHEVKPGHLAKLGERDFRLD